jgi:hypothetical protein
MKFWLGFLCSFVGLSLAWALGLNAQLGNATPSSQWVFDAYQHKHRAAQQVASPKVLIVAGSNAMFGIDSQQISAYWQRPTVNLAVNAGLGLSYILANAQRAAKSGDIIILPLEYALYVDSANANSQIIDYVVARDIPYWNSLPFAQKSAFLLGMSPERWLQGLRKMPEAPVTAGTYGAHHLDAAGDQTFSGPENQQSHDLAAVQLATSPAKAWHYGERATQETGAWDQIRQFASWAKAQHICIVAVPTVLLDHASYHESPLEQQFYLSLPDRVRALGLNYAGRPFDFMYPATHFFDTDHHLQDWARTIHTRKLVALFQQTSYCQAQL